MGSIGEQQATKATQIENMNEAQLNKEIARAERAVARAERQMEKNGQPTSYSKALGEAFPLGAGGDGWTAARRRQLNRDTEKTVRNAGEFTKALQDRDNAQNRLNRLNEALNEVKGTGKTQAELKAEKVKQVVDNTQTTLKWKTTQKAKWENGAYTPKIIKAGNIEIRGGDGYYTIYKNGKQVGTTDKLSKAKAYAERIK